MLGVGQGGEGGSYLVDLVRLAQTQRPPFGSERPAAVPGLCPSPLREPERAQELRAERSEPAQEPPASAAERADQSDQAERLFINHKIFLFQATV